MGERKRRRENFFLQHPRCCFCGGIRKAVEIDHQPPKIFFVNKSSPFSQRFPSCRDCNRNSKGIDTLFAFWSRGTDMTEKYTSDKDIQKLAQAVANNYPEFFPKEIPYDRRNEALLDFDLPISLFKDEEFPIVETNSSLLLKFRLSVAKIALAQFYKYNGECAPLGTEMIAVVQNNVSARAPEGMEMLDKITNLDVPKGANRQTEGQFICRYQANTKEGSFYLLMLFSNSILAHVGIFPNGVPKGPKKTRKKLIKLKGDPFPWGNEEQYLL